MILVLFGLVSAAASPEPSETYAPTVQVIPNLRNDHEWSEESTDNARTETPRVFWSETQSNIEEAHQSATGYVPETAIPEFRPTIPPPTITATDLANGEL
jgi:hypothetical protein